VEIAQAPATACDARALSLLSHPAASNISSAIFFGCEISESWLAFTSIVFAPMRLAMKRSRSGLIVRSSVETAYPLGFVRHAACAVRPASSRGATSAETAAKGWAFRPQVFEDWRYADALERKL